MTRLVGNHINSLVQVVDSNGDKVTDAVVNYKVYFYDYDDDEVWEVAQSGLMTHIGDGLYQAEWTPAFMENTLSTLTAPTPSSMNATHTTSRAQSPLQIVWERKQL